MTDSTLFRRSFVRGLNADLVRTGEAVYPSKIAADLAADFVADRSGMPDPVFEGMDHKIAFELCNMLKAASHFLCQEAGGYSPEHSKTAAALDPAHAAQQAAIEVMQKVAFEQQGGNTLAEAAQHSDGAALDLMNRGEGYAVTGMGNYEDKGVGAVGTEELAHRRDGVDGMNSAVEATKAAQAVYDFLAHKFAGVEGTYTGPDNTLSQAAQHNDAAALDLERRPEGYALRGMGNTDLKPSGAAVVGAEHAVPPEHKPATGSNSATSLSKSAQEKLNKVAQRVLPYLPNTMSDRAKVAHIRAMAKLGSAKKEARYLQAVYAGAGLDKTASYHAANEYLALAMKIAEDEGEEDFEVASALEEAAEELEGEAVEKIKEEAEEKGKEEGETEQEEAKEASLRALQNAAARIANIGAR